MKCSKCGGWMNFEEFTASSGGLIPWSFNGWRCVYCGEVVDAIVLHNRAKMQTLKEENDGATAGPKKGKGDV